MQCVKCKGERKEPFQGQLCGQRETGKPCHHAGAVQMPAEQRRDEVDHPEHIEGPREEEAAVAVNDARVPCYLWLVDGKVGADRSVSTLSGEDVLDMARVF